MVYLKYYWPKGKMHHAERKSIYADLRALSVLGIEVEGESIGNRYHYHVVEEMQIEIKRLTEQYS